MIIMSTYVFVERLSRLTSPDGRGTGLLGEVRGTALNNHMASQLRLDSLSLRAALHSNHFAGACPRQSHFDRDDYREPQSHGAKRVSRDAGGDPHLAWHF